MAANPAAGGQGGGIGESSGSLAGQKCRQRSSPCLSPAVQPSDKSRRMALPSAFPAPLGAAPARKEHPAARSIAAGGPGCGSALSRPSASREAGGGEGRAAAVPLSGPPRAPGHRRLSSRPSPDRPAPGTRPGRPSGWRPRGSGTFRASGSGAPGAARGEARGRGPPRRLEAWACGAPGPGRAGRPPAARAPLAACPRAPPAAAPAARRGGARPRRCAGPGPGLARPAERAARPSPRRAAPGAARPSSAARCGNAIAPLPLLITALRSLLWPGRAGKARGRQCPGCAWGGRAAPRGFGIGHRPRAAVRAARVRRPGAAPGARSEMWGPGMGLAAVVWLLWKPVV